MKIALSPKHKEVWHNWFAWYPITAEDSNGVYSVVWLRIVRRIYVNNMYEMGWAYEI